jgi:hypothetical protein
MNDIQENSIGKILEIIGVLKPLEGFGKVVCAGGAVRDALFNLPNPPKDYDIFIIDDKKHNEPEFSLKRSSIIRFIKGYFYEHPDFWFNEKANYSEYEEFPLANLVSKKTKEKVQIMFKQNTLCEFDLVNSFDWNICSCFISTEGKKYSIGCGDNFPLEIDSRGRKAFFNKASDLKKLGIFLNIPKVAALSEDFKEFQVTKSGFMNIALNKDAKISRPMVSLRRAFSFSSKFSKKYQVRIQKKSLELLSKKIYDISTSNKHEVEENHYLSI